MSVGQLEKLFSDLYSAFDLRELKQIAFEGNPDFLDQRKLRLLKKRGVNRLTIGVQSLDCRVIKAVNRYQSADSFLRCFNEAREAGIENINVDLMAGLPGQSIKSGMATLAAVLALQPEMVHIHPFFPTAGTLFMKKGGELSRADAQRREKMTQMARARIKNSYLRPVKFDACGTKPSAGNLQLSDAVEKISSYLGLGAGAVSHIRGRFRYANGHNIAAYQELAGQKSLPIAFIKELDEKDEMIYYLTACLRYGQVSRSLFAALFGRDPVLVFKKELAYLKKRNKISISGDLIRSRMRDLYEYAVFSKYLYKPELVKKYKKTAKPGQVRFPYL